MTRFYPKFTVLILCKINQTARLFLQVKIAALSRQAGCDDRLSALSCDNVDSQIVSQQFCLTVRQSSSQPVRQG